MPLHLRARSRGHPGEAKSGVCPWLIRCLPNLMQAKGHPKRVAFLYGWDMPYSDPNQQIEYQRQYHPDYDRRRYEEKHALLVKELGGRCARCGSTDDLEFDHIDPSTKAFSIKAHWNRPLEALRDELAKCQLLCQPHHKEKHHRVPACGTRGSYGAGCRCEKCVGVQRDYMRKWRQRRRASVV